jgi:Ca-activated chloride channel family protein
MNFALPHLLPLLWLVPILIIFLAVAYRRKRRALNSFVHQDLADRLTVSVSRRRQNVKAALLVLAILLTVLALARPQYGKKLQMMRRKGMDIVIAMDTSESMLAEDIKPNRLQRAKYEVSTLIDRLQGDRVALVAFAGEGFVQCPLTQDYGAAKMFLDIIDTQIIPDPGTAIGKAIETAMGVFEQKERKYKVMILITDGEDHRSEPMAAAKRAAQEGIRIYTIGVGSPGGVPIPIRGREGSLLEYKKDRQGETVMSKLDEITLQNIALETDGKYFRATMGEMELDRILEDLSKLERRELKTRELSLREDRYQFFVLAAVLLLTSEAMLGDRKRRRRNERAAD